MWSDPLAMGVEGDALLDLQVLSECHLLVLSLSRLQPACGKHFQVTGLIISVYLYARGNWPTVPEWNEICLCSSCLCSLLYCVVLTKSLRAHTPNRAAGNCGFFSGREADHLHSFSVEVQEEQSGAITRSPNTPYYLSAGKQLYYCHNMMAILREIPWKKL
jgi:hypothetical protein